MSRLTLTIPFWLLLSACATTTYAPYPPVPAPRAERVPAPPVSSTLLIWQPGHHDWDGQQFAWIEGRWVERAGHGTLWQDGYWRRDGVTYVWVRGHWI